ncbi:DUF6498-containing protein [Pseudothauera lacus]|uniref:Uncharacterized protein n=1 Tax=Pseudothauera lacus TaxID=2136175 RepID=A0A2T4IH79_9RHOO|nr:DUF6498-containing protein [Pseudothauera lacus]PTD97117.1 hypothetical protein C8261_06955 [Pseudothauera lacus]
MTHDRSLFPIIATNIATIIAALWADWGLGQLLWPYWMQSVIIGFYARRRILALQDFCTEGFKVNNRAVAPTVQTQRQTANFFALHYGGFHFFYLFFLLAFAAAADPSGHVPVTNTNTGEVSMMHIGHTGGLDMLIYLALGVGFWLSHRGSHREHVQADLQRKPNIGTLMFLPYLRVIPMHLTIIFGAVLGGGAALALFATLKTVADVAMHKVEHRWLQAGKTA